MECRWIANFHVESFKFQFLFLFHFSVCVMVGSGIALKTSAQPDVSLKGSLWQHLMENNTSSLENVHMWWHRYIFPTPI